jgi:hypothetical protein
MTTLVDEDGEKVAAFVVTLLAFSLVYFVGRDGAMDCDFTGTCY